MRLTAYTDFSLRVLMYLAMHPDRRPTIAEIAARYGVSKAHLMKVAYQLGLNGYVETQRGKGGGLRLARAPGRITIGEIVRQTEPDLAIVACFDPAGAACVIAPACRLKGKLAEARAAFLQVLDDCTLEEVVGDGQARELLLAS